MTIAVTAVSGQLGSAIARALMSRNSGQDLVGIARSPDKVGIDGLDIRPGDYTDRSGFAKALSGVDTMVMISLNTPPDVRTDQHRIALDAAKDAGVRRIVYTSVQGAEEDTAFSPVIQSNRQTEADLNNYGFDWTVGRNGIYIEPDVSYIETYVKDGGISNSAGDGACGYTSRMELADAYANMALDHAHTGKIYNLHGDLLTQPDLAGYLNQAFGTDLTFRPMSIEDYRADRRAALGDVMGTIIAGIYEGIRNGAFDIPSDYAAAAGRSHQSWDDYFSQINTSTPGKIA